MHAVSCDLKSCRAFRGLLPGGRRGHLAKASGSARGITLLALFLREDVRLNGRSRGPIGVAQHRDSRCRINLAAGRRRPANGNREEPGNSNLASRKVISVIPLVVMLNTFIKEKSLN